MGSVAASVSGERGGVGGETAREVAKGGEIAQRREALIGGEVPRQPHVGELGEGARRFGGIADARGERGIAVDVDLLLGPGLERAPHQLPRGEPLPGARQRHRLAPGVAGDGGGIGLGGLGEERDGEEEAGDRDAKADHGGSG